MPTWEVTATLDEPAPLVLAFVAHHLAMGADRINLYFDRTPQGDLSLLAGEPRVRMTQCDGDYWRKMGWRPPLHVDRQIVNANHAYARGQSEWMLHCDADEFISDGEALRAALHTLPADVPSLRLTAFERCFTADQDNESVFGGDLRGPIPQLYSGSLAAEYPPAVAAMLQNGMTAYVGEKSLSRIGAQVAVGIHHTFVRDRTAQGSADTRTPFARSPDVPLFHFDGLTPRHTSKKLRRKTIDVDTDALVARLGPARMAQIAAFSAPQADPAALFFALRQMPPKVAEVLSTLGLIATQSLRPDTAAHWHWPEATLDFSPQAVDGPLVTDDIKVA